MVFEESLAINLDPWKGETYIGVYAKCSESVATQGGNNPRDENLVSGNTDTPSHGRHLLKTNSSSSNVLECVKVRCLQCHFHWECAFA